MTNKKIYLSYNVRVLLFILFFVLILGSASYYLNKAIVVTEDKYINYKENGNIDYKVILKDNKFYDSKVLDKNLSYISSLIYKVDIDFDYNFKVDSSVNGEYSYEIIGVLEIINSKTKEKYFQKEYQLLDEKYSYMDSNNQYEINENIVINYDDYNKIAQKFKTSYNVDTISNFNVIMKVKRKIDDVSLNNDLNSSSDVKVTIPLSEKTISIKIEYNDVNKEDSVLVNKKLTLVDTMYFACGSVLLSIAIVILIFLSKIINLLKVKETKYTDILKKYKREYDRFLIEVINAPDLDNFDVIKMTSFDELIDIKNIYEESIRYVEINKNLKCYFYVIHENEMFLYILKDADL